MVAEIAIKSMLKLLMNYMVWYIIEEVGIDPNGELF